MERSVARCMLAQPPRSAQTSRSSSGQLLSTPAAWHRRLPPRAASHHRGRRRLSSAHACLLRPHSTRGGPQPHCSLAPSVVPASGSSPALELELDEAGVFRVSVRLARGRPPRHHPHSAERSLRRSAFETRAACGGEAESGRMDAAARPCAVTRKRSGRDRCPHRVLIKVLQPDVRPVTLTRGI